MTGRFTPDSQAPSYWSEGCEFLMGVDDRWASLIRAYPDRALRTRGNPFETLGRSLVGQQISVHAAQVVWERLLGVLKGEFSADAVCKVSDEALRGSGLSGQKVKYLRELTAFERQGGLDVYCLEARTDAEVSNYLCQIKGIGPWTAQMFLIFGIRRPDVWPILDIGIQKAISRVFMEGQPVTPELASQFGQSIKPWRTVASWYLWRSLDPTVVDY